MALIGVSFLLKKMYDEDWEVDGRSSTCGARLQPQGVYCYQILHSINDIVDGRNPSPVNPLITGFYTSQVVSRISEPSTVC